MCWGNLVIAPSGKPYQGLPFSHDCASLLIFAFLQKRPQLKFKRVCLSRGERHLTILALCLSVSLTSVTNFEGERETKDEGCFIHTQGTGLDSSIKVPKILLLEARLVSPHTTDTWRMVMPEWFTGIVAPVCGSTLSMILFIVPYQHHHTTL